MDIKPIQKLAETLTEVVEFCNTTGPLNNAISEVEARMTKARAAEAALTADVEKLRAEIKLLTGKKSDASVRAEKLVVDGEAQAALVVENAKKQAAQIVSAANQSASNVLADAEFKAQSIAFATAEKQKELDAINAEIAEKAKEKTALQKAVDAIKSKFV